MLNWLTENAANIIIICILCACILLTAVNLIRNKKNGKSSCGCDCNSCPSHENCHGYKKRRNKT
ncbi:MAG: FeoB-associated Cys-rich membrane protein [Clostridia bacterium]|nr:FeoB-associated Cys-rich membrane protein [Clostridia bacterium]